ncbi:hypothetical protein FGO68_gene5397 [Halteria grandinella]|uniref:Uncharacterized protein n=1 Tax=Halteria grandinella TaxID=5974 RepID=A0A8J8NKN7_HALGN|nr:hypothetical protein FGO68_gene5397 [Halteria grandinella]
MAQGLPSMCQANFAPIVDLDDWEDIDDTAEEITTGEILRGTLMPFSRFGELKALDHTRYATDAKKAKGEVLHLFAPAKPSSKQRCFMPKSQRQFIGAKAKHALDKAFKRRFEEALELMMENRRRQQSQIDPEKARINRLQKEADENIKQVFINHRLLSADEDL